MRADVNKNQLPTEWLRCVLLNLAMLIAKMCENSQSISDLPTRLPIKVHTFSSWQPMAKNNLLMWLKSQFSGCAALDRICAFVALTTKSLDLNHISIWYMFFASDDSLRCASHLCGHTQRNYDTPAVTSVIRLTYFSYQQKIHVIALNAWILMKKGSHGAVFSHNFNCACQLQRIQYNGCILSCSLIFPHYPLAFDEFGRTSTPRQIIAQ